MPTSPARLLLTGPPKIGKTTVVDRLVGLLRDAGMQVGGFVTHEVRGNDDRRVGFKVRELASDQEVWLARQDFNTGVKVGRFGVDIPAFERVGLPALEAARRSGDVIVIDEIAKMELASDAFVEALDEIFGGRMAVVATVHVHKHSVTDALKRRADIEVVEVTEANRGELPKLLLSRLTSASAD